MRVSPTKFLIALVWIGFIAVSISLFAANLGTNYATAENMNTTYISHYNHLEEMRINAEEMESGISNITIESSFIDIIGAYIREGIATLQIAAKSLTTASAITSDALGNEKLPLGEIGVPLRTAIITSLIILIFLGVVVAALLKWEM